MLLHLMLSLYVYAYIYIYIYVCTYTYIYVYMTQARDLKLYFGLLSYIVEEESRMKSGRLGLNWSGLDWLYWIGPDWTGLDWIRLK